MKTKPFAIIAIASGNAKLLENSRLRNRFTRSSEQDHQIDLATALGEEVPDLSGGPQGRTLDKRRKRGSHRAVELRITLRQMLATAGADEDDVRTEEFSGY